MTGSLPVVLGRDDGLGRHYSAATATESAQPFYSEREINRREIIRVEIFYAEGRPGIRLTRWLKRHTGNKYTGCHFEFGANHCSALASMISDIERELGGLPNGAA